jgi:hypothetical protein
MFKIGLKQDLAFVLARCENKIRSVLQTIKGKCVRRC